MFLSFLDSLSSAIRDDREARNRVTDRIPINPITAVNGAEIEGGRAIKRAIPRNPLMARKVYGRRK